MNREEREALLTRAAEAGVAAPDVDRIRAIFESYEYVTELIDQKNQTLGRLRDQLYGSRTESRDNVLGRGKSSKSAAANDPKDAENHAEVSPGDAAADASDGASAESTPPASSSSRRGHGRRPAADHTGAELVTLRVEGLQPGDECPACHEGTLYEQNRPGILIRFVGRPPIQSCVYTLQKLRCQACGVLLTAQPPAEVANSPKYDASVGAALGVLKYGVGLPFHRTERLQEYAGVPLAASTQWMLVAWSAEQYLPVFAELVRFSAAAELFHNDDTTARILERMGRRREQALHASTSDDGAVPDDGAPPGDATRASVDDPADDPQRKGIFTTSILAVRDGRRVALYFTGARHAGENLNELLRRRAADLPPPVQMCDALSRNYPAEFQTIIANCLAHARRRFVELRDYFLEECRRVIDAFAIVYAADAHARREKYSPEERLKYHQAQSGPALESLRVWLDSTVSERLVEPNSALGAAINYLRGHWSKLTLFLRQAGAPLDNNVCERALKKAILHRKNSLFYKTQRGAEVGDIHMSLIHTCELCAANPFDYLTELQRHAESVAAAPADWLPWNYRGTLAKLARDAAVCAAPPATDAVNSN